MKIKDEPSLLLRIPQSGTILFCGLFVIQKLNIYFTGEIHYEVAAQILLACIHQARKSFLFSLLKKQTQDECLKTVWGALFILKAATWHYDLIVFLGLFPSLYNTIIHARSLSLDPTEVTFIESVISCRKGLFTHSLCLYLECMTYGLLF